MIKVILGLLLTLTASTVVAVDLFADFPNNIHPNEKYVFYSHGLIVEGNNLRPEHPDFGVYDFPLVKQELFKGEDFNLIAHHRPKNTDPEEYATKLARWADKLIQAGVDPSNITLIGFSRGAQITASASHQLSQFGVNTALIAVCFNGDYQTDQPIVLGGNVLSIYEISDVVRSCNKLLERSSNASFTREIAISTGLGHGAFYTPLPEWLEPLKAWLSNNDVR